MVNTQKAIKLENNLKTLKRGKEYSSVSTTSNDINIAGVSSSNSGDSKKVYRVTVNSEDAVCESCGSHCRSECRCVCVLLELFKIKQYRRTVVKGAKESNMV